MNRHLVSLIVTVATLAGGTLAAETVLKVSFDEKTDLQKSGAVIEVQEDDKPALLFGDTEKPQSMMFFWLTKEQCKGKQLKISVQAKGIGLSKGFIFGLQANKNGQIVWPAGTSGSGTFDWKPFSFTADFGALGIDSAAIRIGLQNTQGKVLFRNLKVEVAGDSSTTAAPAPMASDTVAIAPVTVTPTKGTILSLSFDEKTDLQKSGAVIEVQEDDKPAVLFGSTDNPQSMMFFWLTKEQCEGKMLKVSILAKGIGLSTGFIFGLQASKNGQNIWPAGTSGSGSFDWKPFSFTADFGALGIDAAAIRIGLQNTQGKVLFRDLKVEVVDAGSGQGT